MGSDMDMDGDASMANDTMADNGTAPEVTSAQGATPTPTAGSPAPAAASGAGVAGATAGLAGACALLLALAL